MLFHVCDDEPRIHPHPFFLVVFWQSLQVQHRFRWITNRPVPNGLFMKQDIHRCGAGQQGRPAHCDMEVRRRRGHAGGPAQAPHFGNRGRRLPSKAQAWRPVWCGRSKRRNTSARTPPFFRIGVLFLAGEGKNQAQIRVLQAREGYSLDE